MMILPRQARDKHRENSKTDRFCCRVAVEVLEAAGHHLEEFQLAALNDTEGQQGQGHGQQGGLAVEADVSIPTAMATFFSLISSVRNRTAVRPIVDLQQSCVWRTNVLTFSSVLISSSSVLISSSVLTSLSSVLCRTVHPYRTSSTSPLVPIN